MAPRTTLIAGVLATVVALLVPPVLAGGPQLGSMILPDLPPDYDWWNGCAPTAAGMLFAWWGQQDYGVFPGNYPSPPPTYDPTSTDPADYADARGVIAGWAHKQSGIDLGIQYGSYQNHPPSSIADFLLTHDGNTSSSSVRWGLKMFGAWDDPATPQIESRRFLASSYSVPSWTYDQYVAEIDAGRPVYLGWSSPSLLGHATLGIGYNNTDGRHDTIVLTTWHQGPQEWQWTNETSSTYHLSVDSGATMRPLGVAPKLSAYFSIARDYVGDLTVEVGAGSPQNPEWTILVWNRYGGLEHNLVVTDIDCTAQLSRIRTTPLNWYLKVTSDYPQYPGTIEDFQIRYGLDQHVFKYTGSTIPVVANGAAYVYLNTTPFAIWQGAGTAPGSWGNDALWDQGTPQYAGDTATLGNSIGNTSVAVVTLDGNRTISGLTFSNTLGGGYQIAQGTAGSLILENGTSPVSVTVSAGSHSITAPVLLISDVAITTAPGTALSISAPISGDKSLTKDGAGTLTLTAAPAYSGSTTVSAGTLTYNIGSGTPTVGADAVLTIDAGATVNVRGQVDPFSAGAEHLSIINNSSASGLNILAGSYTIGTLSGVGATTLAGGTTLTAYSICQDTLTIGMGERGILRGTALTLEDERPVLPSGSAPQVPEPGTAALLLPVALLTLVWWRTRRTGRQRLDA